MKKICKSLKKNHEHSYHYQDKEEKYPQIYLENIYHSKIVTVAILFKVGSQEDIKKQYGIAHVLEHFIFRGTQSRPSIHDFFTPFISLGAEINGETTREHTIYYCTVLKSHFKQIIQLLFELVKQPLFDPKSVSYAKESALNELYLDKSDPIDYLVDQILIPHLLDSFGKKVSHPTSGNPKDIHHITYENLLEFYCRHYKNPQKIIISVSGNLFDMDQSFSPSQEDFLRLIEFLIDAWESVPYLLGTGAAALACPIVTFDLFSIITTREDLTLPFLQTEQTQNKKGIPILLEEKKEMDESYISLGWKMNIKSKTLSELNLIHSGMKWISNYLTAEFISKLYLKLRYEYKFIYAVSSFIEQFQKNVSLFIIICETYEINKIHKIVCLILEEIEKLKTFSNELELLRWKSFTHYRESMISISPKEKAIKNARQLARYGSNVSNYLSPNERILNELKEVHIRDIAHQIFGSEPIVAILKSKSNFARTK